MENHSRRGFLAKVLGACWAGATLLEQAVFRAAHARAQAAQPLPTLFDLEKLAEGVFAAIARPQAIVNCNAAIFENDSDVLIVDAHSKPGAVASLVGQIRREITDKPVRYIVNSHFHWDHIQGTAAYKRIAPRADVIASQTTRRLVIELGAARLKASLEQARKSLETYRERASAASSAEERSYFVMMEQETRDYLAEMKGQDIVPPTVTFYSELVIHDKAHELHLAFRGKAHTAGDIIVWCPQKKVVATGDLAHGSSPFIGDGYPRDWPATLRDVASFEFASVAGGHGPPLPSRDRLLHMADYIEELTGLVERGARRGKTSAELQKEITPVSLGSLKPDQYGEYLGANLLKYRRQPPGATPAQVLEASVAQNVEQVYAALERT